MLNAVSTQTYDVFGYVLLDVTEASAFHPVVRRVNRVKTLDGGASLNDGGYAAADRTIELRWTRNTAALHEAISRLVALYPRLVVSTRDGVFLAAPEAYSPTLGESSLRLLVISKLSA